MNNEVSAETVDLVKSVVEESLGTVVTEWIPTDCKGEICRGFRLQSGCGQLFVKVLRKPHVSLLSCLNYCQ